MTTAVLVLLGAALTPVGEQVAATASDPVTRALADRLLGGSESEGETAPAPASPPVGETAAAPASPPEGETAPAPVARERVPEPRPTPVPRVGTGELVVVPSGAPAPGPGSVRRYLVEVEAGLGVDPEDFAAAVHATLNDPRSWAADGELAFERVGDANASRAAFRVALASPDTTDRLCAPLRTNGELSCHNGGRAVLNLERWLEGVVEHPELSVYRQYLVNHEVGHALGHGHESCPGAGELAPVMQQQSMQVAPCRPNAWPHPERSAG